jgi:phage baseplate assembly protein W
MTITRADVVLNNKKTETFSDFLNNFNKTPFGNQLGRVTDVSAVNQSLRNLIKTNITERFFQPTVGSNINYSLFEMNDFTSMTNIEFFITTTINNNEPRVNLIDVTVTESTDYNTLTVIITYNLINNSNQINLTFPLKRIR